MAFTFYTGRSSSYWGGSWNVAIPSGITTNYYNRKYHPPTMTYHYWVTSTPDPDMNQTTPPNTKSEYVDHVIVKVVAGN